jgi:hypothetical protein
MEPLSFNAHVCLKARCGEYGRLYMDSRDVYLAVCVMGMASVSGRGYGS